VTDTYLIGTTGVFMDPPYPETEGYVGNEQKVFDGSLKWFLDNYKRKYLRIVFCCQDKNIVGKNVPSDVRRENWSRDSGYATDKSINETELILYSDACLDNKKVEINYNIFDEEE
jgi:hypothetical protein